MRCFANTTADLVWQEAVAELIDRPDYIHNGRNGKTKEILPCVLRIENPRKRWILSRHPPYNPAFGLVEFIWLMTGNNESRVLNYWNPALPKFAGDGATYHGAYGFRLRQKLGLDQIKRAYEVLSSAPETRQTVLQIWKPDIDMPAADGKPVSPDVPCNITSLLKVRDGRLHWSQIMRSNDIMRGLPYNFIQFTMLQEFMASWLGYNLGEYVHFSDSLHIYEQDAEKFCSIPKYGSDAKDTQELVLSYEETQELFLSIYKELAAVAEGDIKVSVLREIFDRESRKNRSRCEPIKDMMVVIGSDAARRYGFGTLGLDLAQSCADTSLRTASLAWLDYMGARNGN